MTGRRGGHSAGDFGSLNLGYHVPDDPARVANNRQAVTRVLGLPGGRATFGEQVHGGIVALVNASHARAGWDGTHSALPGTDGLVTTTPGLALGILVADCFPLAVWDAQAGALGVAHCGWRGVADGIIETTIAVLAERGGADTARFGAWVGAGIGPCCFEVGPEVLDQLPGAPARRSEGDRWQLDLPTVIGHRLCAAGLAEGSLEFAGICTSCDSDRFFSHRRATRASSPSTGRQALFAWMER